VQKKGEKLTLLVNGCLQFDDDVTPEDIECIASISYNGSVFVSGPAKSALARKVKTGNGFMGDSSAHEKMTGKKTGDLLHEMPDEEGGRSTINLGVYILS
jgi:hypothetical protein